MSQRSLPPRVRSPSIAQCRRPRSSDEGERRSSFSQDVVPSPFSLSSSAILLPLLSSVYSEPNAALSWPPHRFHPVSPSPTVAVNADYSPSSLPPLLSTHIISAPSCSPFLPIPSDFSPLPFSVSSWQTSSVSPPPLPVDIASWVEIAVNGPSILRAPLSFFPTRSVVLPFLFVRLRMLPFRVPPCGKLHR
ncbi:hypothetical protein Nepgr_003042 [Nepenthes gracilis]|uniref:Uncharacterized protein n=1 Tax=Nepenthes gracilis TaxID=150966 RepID=A0AAD3RYS8_NEPGR|nr:hypothetical protein Nepgr_003042 [Nepenthes gracilis]